MLDRIPTAAALAFLIGATAVAAQDDPGAQVAAAATVEAAQAEDTPPDAANAQPDPEPLRTILPATGVALDDFLWLKRPVVVFADSPADPRYVQQMQFITDRLDALRERDVVVITDTDPAARSEVRRTLRPRGFMLAVLAKDGTVITRKPSPWDVREISRSIDKQLLRQQEIRDRLN